MLVARKAAALALVVAACAPAGQAPTEPPPPAEAAGAPVTSGSSTTTIRLDPVSFFLDSAEAVATGGGVRLKVTDEYGEELGWLDRESPELTVATAAKEITLEYLAPDGSPGGVAWTQPVVRPQTTVRQSWRGRGTCAANLPDGSTADIALVWQANGSPADYLAQLDATQGAVTVVSPIWWRMRPDGTLRSFTDRGYVHAVHDRNVAIWPAVAGFDADAIHAVLSSSERRTALAVQLSEEARRIGADGINIDIEGYREEDAEAFVAWVEELADLAHEWGGVVSFDLVPRSDASEIEPKELAFWSTAPRRAELSRVTDCTVLMAYDQFNRYRPAGPVASPAWVEEVLTYALRYTDPGELVLGIPFYGRIWDPAQLDRPRALGIGRLAELAEDGKATFDEEFGLDRVDLPNGTFFWAETPAGLTHRFELVDELDLAGWAAWRLGFDGPEIWDVVTGR
jgi:spore germination protein YaaH